MKSVIRSVPSIAENDSADCFAITTAGPLEPPAFRLQLSTPHLINQTPRPTSAPTHKIDRNSPLFCLHQQSLASPKKQYLRLLKSSVFLDYSPRLSFFDHERYKVLRPH
jgi:hypothetical protein